jgi:hypothetical protein
MKRIAVLAATAALLSAPLWAKKPVYQAAEAPNRPGYLTATPAADGLVTVVYTGAKGMNKAQVAEFALLRAAELTRESGEEWFAVMETRTQDVELAKPGEELQSHTGGFISGGEAAGTGTGGGRAASPSGTADSSTRGGPSTGGFGGGDVPYQVLERWTPPKVFQTALVIRMGKGDNASFPGVQKAPEIFGAEATEAEIRAKMEKKKK